MNRETITDLRVWEELAEIRSWERRESKKLRREMRRALFLWMIVFALFLVGMALPLERWF